ncbi:MAG: molybdopterin-dependent oxidoreductase [Proteobacteria bacterium]|nr:molybdopterin-dependent oxidoreductase [Pseudomonadota bacterium]MBU1740693.1 molybdopterin-dependent oxidoreductase [Pseudomonadota bacterium]
MTRSAFTAPRKAADRGRCGACVVLLAWRAVRACRTRVLKITGVYDPGTIINPAALTGQIEGGAVMGPGYALTEEYVHPDTDSFGKYPPPRIKDVPEIESIFLETPRDKGPFGATGIGEIGIVGVAPAVCNAIFDACGARVRSRPATPGKILAALASDRAGRNAG